MSGVAIARMSAAVEGAEDLARVDRMQRRLAEGVLQHRQVGAHGHAGEWCVRRLELRLVLAADELDATAADRWADLLAGVVRDLVPDGRNVLHYRNRSQALAELAEGLLSGDTRREWAWRSLGLIGAEGSDSPVHPAAALVAALGAEPRLALAVIAELAERGRFERLDRLLGEPGWLDLGAALGLDLTPQPVGAAATPAAAVAAVLAGSSVARAVRRLPRSAGARVVDGSGHDRRVGVWAALAVAEVSPGRTGLLASVAAALRTGPADDDHDDLPGSAASSVPEPTEAPRTRHPGQRSAADEPSSPSLPGTSRSAAGPRPQTPSEPPTRHRPSEDVDAHRPAPSLATDRPGRAAALQAAPAAEGPRERRDHDRDEQLPVSPEPTSSPAAEPSEGRTVWGGLLYLLNTAGAAAIPTLVESEPRLGTRTTRWVLHALAQRLVPVAADDPAALALAGLPPQAEPPTGDRPTGEEDAALAEHAARWTGLTMDRLSDDDAPASVWALARRPARILADPGWLEVELDLDDVDPAIRRTGLDLDPGWLDWLGTVVRFSYV